MLGDTPHHTTVLGVSPCLVMPLPARSPRMIPIASPPSVPHPSINSSCWADLPDYPGRADPLTQAACSGKSECEKYHNKNSAAGQPRQQVLVPGSSDSQCCTDPQAPHLGHVGHGKLSPPALIPLISFIFKFIIFFSVSFLTVREKHI